jgi:hypothetical protein
MIGSWTHEDEIGSLFCYCCKRLLAVLGFRDFARQRWARHAGSIHRNGTCPIQEFLEGLKHPEVIGYSFAGALPDIQSET